MTEYTVAETDDITDGERAIVQIEGKPIGIFNLDGDYYAYLSWCAHQSGPCCEGNITGTTEAGFDSTSLQTTVEWVQEGKILNCPWHGWEYDLTTGNCLTEPGVSLPSFPVSVRDGEIIVEM
jgi:nitrite reductase/ring-hydroxylating ferredoxin subunit